MQLYSRCRKKKGEPSGPVRPESKDHELISQELQIEKGAACYLGVTDTPADTNIRRCAFLQS